MELAQALILTNALGGFSSLGHAAHAQTPPYGGLISLRNGYFVEVVCQAEQIEVYAFVEDGGVHDDLQPALPPALKSIPGAALLPGSLLLRASDGEFEVPLGLSGDHLAADVLFPDDHFQVAVELVVQGQTVRSEYTTVQPPLPDEA